MYLMLQLPHPEEAIAPLSVNVQPLYILVLLNILKEASKSRFHRETYFKLLSIYLDIILNLIASSPVDA